MGSHGFNSEHDVPWDRFYLSTEWKAKARELGKSVANMLAEQVESSLDRALRSGTLETPKVWQQIIEALPEDTQKEEARRAWVQMATAGVMDALWPRDHNPLINAQTVDTPIGLAIKFMRLQAHYGEQGFPVEPHDMHMDLGISASMIPELYKAHRDAQAAAKSAARDILLPALHEHGQLLLAKHVMPALEECGKEFHTRAQRKELGVPDMVRRAAIAHQPQYLSMESEAIESFIDHHAALYEQARETSAGTVVSLAETRGKVHRGDTGKQL